MAMDRQIARLRELSAEVEAKSTAGAKGLSGKRGSGRYGRKPDFAKMSAPSSRPKSDRGVTFHFKHSFISKTNSVASGYRDLTSAPAHQRYIERANAAEIAVGPDGERREISFGNLGATKEERADFWRKVEASEGRTGRVQCRMIIELPHEMSQAGREAAARGFMRILSDRGFPNWAVIHAPDDHNDKRNYHLHAVYYDRPAKRMPDGRWDFEVVTEGTWANGKKVKKRPLRQNKDKEARGREWIRRLRNDWAETVNAGLEKEGLEKRHDPRPYRESGVGKMPTAHLGNKVALAESQGIDTKLGAENARREMRFRLARPDAAFEHAAEALDAALGGMKEMAAAGPTPQIAKALEAALSYRRVLSGATRAAKNREANLLAEEVVDARMGKRAAFLDSEYDRLTRRPPAWLGEADALRISSDLWQEKRLIDAAADDIAPFKRACKLAADRHDQETARLDAEKERLASEMLLAFPPLRQILRPSEIAALTVPLAFRPMPAQLRTRIPAQPAIHGNGPEAADIRKPVQPAPSPERTDQSSTVPPQPVKPVTPPPAETTVETRPEESRKDAVRPKLEISGALSAVDEKEARAVSEAMRELPGWQIRYHALATRDAAAFADDDETAKRHEAAYAAIEAEASRRGLDLDTGRMDPRKALDAAAFERWKQELERLPEETRADPSRS